MELKKILKYINYGILDPFHDDTSTGTTVRSAFNLSTGNFSHPQNNLPYRTTYQLKYQYYYPFK